MAFEDAPLFLLLSFMVSITHFVVTSGLTDSEILLKFKGSLSNVSALRSWSEKAKPCNGAVSNWEGVVCVNDSISGLQLEGMRLSGNPNVEILEIITELRSLNFKNNGFNCPFPNLKKLVSLRSIHLSNNHFSGAIPDKAFEGMLKLKKVFLANNKFEGAIPSSLADLPNLFDLRLEGNKFTGKLPDFKQKFASFNVSNNELDGPIPKSLGATDFTSFSGNKGLCGHPLEQCAILNSSSSSKSVNKKLSIASLVVVAIVVTIAMVAITGAVFILFNRQKPTPISVKAHPLPSNLGKKDPWQGLQESSTDGKKADQLATLCFVRDGKEKFDLPDLLQASAEILGSGCFGSSYKAALSTGTTVVVKRFKLMNNVGQEEFDEHMRRLGRLRHPNILPLVAYCYRKEEKLLVTDYVDRGSLAAHLHGHRAIGQPSLDWATRLKIVKGIGNGLMYIYKENPAIKAAHGHLKSSNVLISQSYQALLTDYGLVHLVNQEDAHQLMMAYKSPEYMQSRRITKKTDVWSFGILIIELLTGKIPINVLAHGKAKEEEDLATWVSRISQEQWMSEVFDKEMKASKNNEGQMMKLLKIGLSCCEGDVNGRLDLTKAVEKINEVKEKVNNDDDDDFYPFQ